VSRTIFSVWDCVPYKSDADSSIYYLRRDLKVNCDSDDHKEMIIVAAVLVVIWPIGMPIFFFFALFKTRKELRKSRRTGLKETPFSNATRFLTGGYKPRYFYWETIELFRRLTCSGFIILIPHAYIYIRIVTALLVSLLILVVTAAIKPFRNPEDNNLALVSQTILVLVFGICGLIRVINADEGDISNEVKTKVFGFNHSAGLFIIIALCFVLFLVMIFGSYAYKINEQFQMKIRKRGKGKALESSTWILWGALIFGVLGLVVGGIPLGIIGGLIGSLIFVVIGAALGAIAFTYFKGAEESFKRGAETVMRTVERKCSKDFSRSSSRRPSATALSSV